MWTPPPFVRKLQAHPRYNQIVVVVFVIIAALYGALGLYSYLHKTHLLTLLVLPLRYLLLLPASALVLLRPSQAPGFPRLGRPTAIALLLYLIAAIAVSHYVAPSVFIPDESAYRFQARIFSSRHLFAAPLPGASVRNQDNPRYLYFEHHILSPERWYTKYPPAWPLVLAIGVLLHAVWLVNPILSVVLVLLTAAIARRLYGADAAWLSALLLLGCPYFFAQSMSDMPHVFCAILIAGATYFFIRTVQEQRLLFAALSFLLLACAYLVRPFTAFAISVVFGLAVVVFFARDRRRFVQILAIAALSGVLAAAGILGYNKICTGNPLLSPYAIARSSSSVSELSLSPKEIAEGVSTNFRIEVQNTVICTVPFIFLLAIAGTLMREKDKRMTFFLAALFPALVLFYLLQPEASGSFNGERYYFEGFFAVAIVAAWACIALGRRWNVAPSSWAIILAAFGAIQILMQAGAAYTAEHRTEPYRQMAAKLASLHLNNAIVFMTSTPPFQAHHFNLNAAEWQTAPVIYLGDPGPDKRREVAQQFGRPRWIVITFNETHNRPELVSDSAGK